MKNEKLALVLNEKVEKSQLRLTRRELLESGLIGFAAHAAIPGAVASILTASTKAYGQSEAAMIPFITLSLSGGAALHGNFVVRNSGGDLLGSYRKLGLGRNGFGITNLMGAQFASSSQMHRGIQSVCPTAALSKTKLVGICTNTANDTTGNAATRPFYDLSGPLERAGLVGKILPSAHKGSNLENLRPVFTSPSSVLSVTSLSTLTGALQYSSALANNNLMGSNQRKLLSKFVNRMTQSQVAKLNSTDEGVKTALQEAGIKSNSIIQSGGGTDVDPRRNVSAQAVYGITTATATNNDSVITAAVVMNALNGNISHGRITMGGYDYHSPGLRNVADTKDYASGQMIGRMIALAHRMAKPVFIFVTTDGSCVAAESESATSIWSSDYQSSVQFIISYDPSGKLKSSGSQIGHYSADQSVDTSTLVGSRPDYVAAAILANYLNLNNKLGIFRQLAPATLQADDLEKVVKLHAS